MKHEQEGSGVIHSLEPVGQKAKTAVEKRKEQIEQVNGFQLFFHNLRVVLLGVLARED